MNDFESGTGAMELFVYGTLQDPDVFRIVTGKTPVGRPHVLENHQACHVLGECYPGLRPSLGARTTGLLVKVDPLSLERILYFEEAGVAYALEKTPCGISAFFPLSSLKLAEASWSLETWTAIHKAEFLQSAHSFMAGFKSSPLR